MKASNQFISILQEQISDRLKEKNITANMVEKKAGLKISAVRNILSGKSKNPGIEILLAISSILECSIDELLGKNTSINKPSTPAKAQEANIWNFDLYKDCLNSVQNYIDIKKLKLSAEQMLFFTKEVYLYSLSGSEIKADQRFTKWIIDNNI